MRKYLIAAMLTTLILFLLTACSPKTTVIVTTVSTPTNTSTTLNWDDVPRAYPDVPEITAIELKKMMDEGKPLFIIDVRDQPSYAWAHIPGSANFPFDPAADPNDMLMRLWMIPDGRTVVFYCDCPDDNTSGRFATELIKMGGYDDVRDLRHGITAWQNQGYPFVRGATVDEFVTITDYK